ncbi:MAG TPA: hypothetical protein VM120_01740, partial [Bryobacteraceae bacterium]|nr:hypothetical protein [Bryobacteraceae bacterium]
GAGGRFVECQTPRLPDAAYKQRRSRYIGLPAAQAALDIAGRLERDSGVTLASRYFPELSLGFQAACGLMSPDAPAGLDPEFFHFDCIAIDECQDLTAMEAFVLVALAGAIRTRKRAPIPFLVAGDEAQTVRPTDFEWAWLSEMLHNFLMTPQEFRLQSNLRSPRQIAQVVNNVWDLYSEVEKKDRPSGSGYAEIDDDAADQIFYCAAAPGEELNSLFADLAGREGLALIAMEDTIPKAVPQKFHSSILTVAEAKGLDFHTACLIDAGKVLDSVFALEGERSGMTDLASIRRRLSIDRLRVALSRPTDRLIWLDVQPKQDTVNRTMAFFNPDKGAHTVTLVIPSAVQTALAEEQLDVEERVQRCVHDARQYLSIRPEIAWSRAHQAVTLLGEERSNRVWVSDVELRKTAYLTLAEVCFRLAMLGVKLPPELGSPKLMHQASQAATSSGSAQLGRILFQVGFLDGLGEAGVASLAENIVKNRQELPEWFFQSIAPKASLWATMLEVGMRVPENAGRLAALLPDFYDAVSLPDAESRKRTLMGATVHSFMQNRRFQDALGVLEKQPERDYDREAQCYRGMGDLKRAAQTYLKVENFKEALACYREIPDFDAAYKLIRSVGDHPAAASYLWLSKLRKLLEERPAEFQKVMTAGERVMLEQIMEQGLGVTRKKAAPRKTAPKPAADPGVRRKVDLYLKEHPASEYCDECLSTLTMVQSKEKVNMAVRELIKAKVVLRGRASCSHCRRPKMCNTVLPITKGRPGTGPSPL